jgi:hypothetical protein
MKKAKRQEDINMKNYLPQIDYDALTTIVVRYLSNQYRAFTPKEFARDIEFKIANTSKMRLCDALMHHLCIKGDNANSRLDCVQTRYSIPKGMHETISKRIFKMQLELICLDNDVFQTTNKPSVKRREVIEARATELREKIDALPRDEHDFKIVPQETTKISSSYNEKTGEFEYISEDLTKDLYADLEKLDDSITEIKLSISKEIEKLNELNELLKNRQTERAIIEKQIEDKEKLMSICENAGISLEELKRLVNKA